MYCFLVGSDARLSPAERVRPDDRWFDLIGNVVTREPRRG
jgi:hypothetical protein